MKVTKWDSLFWSGWNSTIIQSRSFTGYLTKISTLDFAFGFILLVAAPQIFSKTFEKNSCPPTVSKDKSVECGTLMVLENRAKSSGNLIKLPVMIFHSRSKHPAPDPIIFFPGGPGGSAMPTFEKNSENNPFLDDRDFILMEPRGAKASSPALECPRINMIKGEISAGRYLSDADTVLTRAVTDCRSKLTSQGVDLNAYTSEQTAEDAEDLRKILGIKEWNIFGHSYGTRLALTFLRHHPESVRSAILDSVLPPEARFDENASENLLRAIQTVFNNCASTPTCSSAYPNLPKDFAKLVALTVKRPLYNKVHILGSDKKPVRIGGAQIVDAVYAALHDPEKILKIPDLIENSLKGKTNELFDLIKNNQGPDGFSWGLRLSVWCAEFMPFEDPVIVGNQILLSWGLGGIDERAASVAMCKAWNVSRVDAAEVMPVNSEVPILILTGEYDPDTPPDWGRSQVKNLPNSLVVMFAGQSHGAGFNRCGASIKNAFLRDPKAMIDTTCASNSR